MTSTIVSTKRNRGSNWEAEFYKNGYPKEIIVIEDTPPPDQSQSSSSTTAAAATVAATTTAGAQYTVVPAPAPPRSIMVQHNNSRTSTLTTTTKRSRNNIESRLPPLQPPPLAASAAVAAAAATSGINAPPKLTDYTPSNKRRRKQYAQPLNALATPASSYYSNVAAATIATNTTTAASVTSVNNSASSTTPRELADKDGHFIVRNGDFLTDRYQIQGSLGQGTYGKVVKCYDHVRRCYVAVKIIRAIPKYKEASQTEIRVLDTLKENDHLNFNQCIHLIEWFEYCNHVCMVFELLDQSVFDFLKANHFEPFPVSHIQQFAKQLLTSVAFTHELKIIHTDLKPENILLKSRECSEIQNPRSKRGTMRVLHNTDIVLIDFGSATFEEDYHSSVVSTRHYRAPEIILGLGWSYPCDVWSIGCILVEFFTGEALFQTHDNLEHLAMMEMVLGKIPARLAQAASPEAAKYFRNGRLCYPPPETTPQNLKYVKGLKPLRNIIVPKTRTNLAFMDLIQKMLTYDPAKRITAREALRHRFFHVDFDQYGQEVRPS